MKRYMVLPILLCFLLSGCSELFPDNYYEQKPHKEIADMKWTPDGKTLLVSVGTPISQSGHEYKLYSYNSKGVKIAETGVIQLRSIQPFFHYVSADGKFLLGEWEYGTVGVLEVATGKVTATYDNTEIVSQVYGTDEYLVRTIPYGLPYTTYRVVKMTNDGIEEISTIRILTTDGFYYSVTPFFASEKRLVTGEYDSLNTMRLVIRDSLLNTLEKIRLPDSAKYLDSRAGVFSYVSSRGDMIVFTGYQGRGFLVNLSDGSLDTSSGLKFYSDKVQLNSDGSKIYTSGQDQPSVASYDLSTKAKTILSTYGDGKYPSMFTISPDDKYLAIILEGMDVDDELQVIQLP
jgi:WD40 repeat protein